jgi:hypothetical protein
MASKHFLSTIASIFSSMLSLALAVGLLVIALTTVKRARPDAMMPLVAAAVIQIAATFLHNILYDFLYPALLHGESIRDVYALTSIVMTLIHAVATAALLFGIVKLATPPSGVPRDPTRYG